MPRDDDRADAASQAGRVGAEASIQTILELFHYNRFEIPPYQRDYSWGEAQIEELLEDLYTAYCANTADLPEPAEYFLGSIVTQVNGGDSAKLIVDGQQRTTSLMLLLCVAAEKIGDTFLRDVLPLIHKTVPGGVGEPGSGRFVVHVPVQDYYLRRLMAQARPVIGAARGRAPLKTASVERLERNFEHINQFLTDYFHRRTEGDDPAGDPYFDRYECASFIIWILERAYVAHIRDTKPDDDQNLFEKINSRGLPLTESQRFQSYVISTTRSADGTELARQWRNWQEKARRCYSNLSGAVQRDPAKCEEALLIAWLSAQSFRSRRSSEPPARVIRRVRGDTYDMALRHFHDIGIRRLQKSLGTTDAYTGDRDDLDLDLHRCVASTFFAFVDWADRTAKSVRDYDPAFVGFQHAQIVGVPAREFLLAACHHPNLRNGQTDMCLQVAAQLLDRLAFAMGWGLMSRNEAQALIQTALPFFRVPGERSELTANVNQLLTAIADIDTRKPPIFSDGSGEQTRSSLKHRKWIAHLLGRMVVQLELRVVGECEIDPLMNPGGFQIEHILPNDFRTSAPHFNHDAADFQVARSQFGNLTLIETERNQQLGNKPLPEKLRVYRECNLLTRTLCADAYTGQGALRGAVGSAPQYGFGPAEGYDVFTREMIDRRTESYAALCRDIWMGEI